MNIEKEKIDELNAVLKIEIIKEDYEKNVNEELKNYRKKAVIPGFRKGLVPINFLKKKYGKTLIIQKVEQILQEKVSQYLKNEKLEILGGAIPKTQENFSWDAEHFNFEFELGMAPKFAVKMPAKNKIKKYKIIADEKFVTKEIENLKEKTEKKEFNQEFFDSIFGKDVVKNEEELKTKIKKTAQKNFATQSDQHFLNNTLEYLVKNTKFELPEKFLKKWLQHKTKEPKTQEQIAKEYENLEKSLRYELVESQILKEHNISINQEDLKNYTSNFIKKQMAMYGKNISKEELNATCEQVLKNPKEAQRLKNQMVSEKLLAFFKEHINSEEKEINYDAFIKEISKK